MRLSVNSAETSVLMMELSHNAKLWTQIFLRPLSFVIIPRERWKAAENQQPRTQGCFSACCVLWACKELVDLVQVLPPPVEESQVVSASGCSTNFVLVIPNKTHMMVTWWDFMQMCHSFPAGSSLSQSHCKYWFWNQHPILAIRLFTDWQPASLAEPGR